MKGHDGSAYPLKKMLFSTKVHGQDALIIEKGYMFYLLKPEIINIFLAKWYLWIEARIQRMEIYN
ncbi:hypothetical protein CR203_10945 [Salipaludibacillus neizhouensis]|uniref:Uncharacterized protein n=1 Tax=Salipaludibacillus neizhouensis TaxID=885475 RepID=A0A3A9K3X3_9BACI|nr:hypothetical protein CR203_10945 [Salipaludibacillus neizhouensis]